LEPQLGAHFFVDFNRSGVLGAPVEILQVKETNDAWHMVSNLDTPFKKKLRQTHHKICSLTIAHTDVRFAIS
jgi:hypothetical protein